MRVLTVVDALRLGGAETLIAQLARVASEADLQLTVVSLHGESPELSKLAPMMRAVGIEPVYLDVRRTLDVRGFRRLVKVIKDSRAEVVHAHLEMAMTMAVPAARVAGVPSVGTFHHVQRPLAGRASLRERLAVEVASRAAATIFVSTASLDSFAARYRRGRRVPKGWTVVHNGIDLEQFSPAVRPPSSMPADLGLEEHRVVTVLAALRNFKGISNAIDAWPAVLRSDPELRLLLVGSGEEEPRLRDQVRGLGLEGSVVFAGMRTDVVDVLRASEVVVLPSIYGENLPTVLMEAGGCERPVVASDVGGISDIVVDGETGLLTPPGDSGSIALAVVRLLEDPEEAARMGRAGRRHMEAHFDARGWARGLHDVYAGVIGSANGSRP